MKKTYRIEVNLAKRKKAVEYLKQSKNLVDAVWEVLNSEKGMEVDSFRDENRDRFDSDLEISNYIDKAFQEVAVNIVKLSPINRQDTPIENIVEFDRVLHLASP